MKIAIVGYGKMGRMIKHLALKRGHEVVVTIDIAAEDADVKVAPYDGDALVRAVKSSGAEGIIEFSHPSSAAGNVCALLPLGLPIVVGTTGWAHKEDQVEKMAQECGGTVMRSSNFSVGVNLFYKIVAETAKLMQEYEDFDCAIWEMHHNQKADSPSGTALEIARRVMKNDCRKKKIVVDAFHEKPAVDELHVSSTRCGSNPGVHTVFFDNSSDTIELTHRSRSREGLASGAVVALERLCEKIKTGELSRGKMFGMDDIF